MEKHREQLTDLKTVLHSKRANIYYLEKCRVMQKNGCVLYLTEAKDSPLKESHLKISSINGVCAEWHSEEIFHLLIIDL